jgi:hypothetical protein
MPVTEALDQATVGIPEGFGGDLLEATEQVAPTLVTHRRCMLRRGHEIGEEH